MTISRLLSKTAFHSQLARMGACSMDVYVIHMFIIKFLPMNMNMQRDGIASVYATMAIIALAIVLIIWALSTLLRKIRLYRISIGMG